MLIQFHDYDIFCNYNLWFTTKVEPFPLIVSCSNFHVHVILSRQAILVTRTTETSISVAAGATPTAEKELIEIEKYIKWELVDMAQPIRLQQAVDVITDSVFATPRLILNGYLRYTHDGRECCHKG